MIPVHMELSKFTEMKVTPKVYCVRQTNGGLQSQLAIILCGIHPIIKSSNQMLPTSRDVWRIKYSLLTPLFVCKVVLVFILKFVK